MTAVWERDDWKPHAFMHDGRVVFSHVCMGGVIRTIELDERWHTSPDETHVEPSVQCNGCGFHDTVRLLPAEPVEQPVGPAHEETE